MINNSRTKILKANSPKINIIETKKKWANENSRK